MELNHLDKNGQAIMVDVGRKDATERVAVAEALVKMQPATLDLILSGGIQKGDVFACARVAGILAAKRTPELIPLCHPIPLTNAAMEIAAAGENAVRQSAALSKCRARKFQMA